ncbi:MAG: cystathionine gamma-synthase [Flavobacteriales bacterium]|nr:MAG: cystathionine gamma-synthase [Flavobacteriales bacterium]
MKFNSKTIHGGQEHDPSTGAVMPPIYQTSTYAQISPGKHKGYEYSRAANPTRTALESNLAAIENGTHGFAFASGLSAINAVLKLLNPGDEVIAGDDLYGGSYRMFTRIFQKYGLQFHFVNMENTASVLQKMNKNTKLIWIETPTNPLIKMADIADISRKVKDKNKDILVAVDNTFATPYLQIPLDLGADIVMHSVTKYLGGHSDLIMGALVVKDKNLAEQIHFIQFAGGAVAGPQDCFLALRGIKTLHVRMQRHCENGLAIARFLEGHPKVKTVYYPGLKNNPGYEIAKKQMKAFGGMVSFRLKLEKKLEIFKVLESFKVFTLAESLGGVESLVNHPETMTHASIPEKERKKTGIDTNLIRLSVGIEDIDDLINDLKHALGK